MQSFANENLRKVLLLSAASWFETRVSEAILRFSAVHSNSHPGIQSVIKRKVVDRQYHTYFDWKAKKPGPFYAMFGEECGGALKNAINASAGLKKALDDFIELGSLRNELVHENFASYIFDKTAAEVYALFQSAEQFVIFVETKLADPAFGREPALGEAP